ncbi:MAG: MMPL family transporter [Polyangiaceae bacterium]
MFSLRSLAEAVIQRSRTTVVLCLLLLVGAIALLIRGGTLTSGAISGTESEHGRRLVEEALQRPGASTFTIVYASPSSDVRDENVRAAIRSSLEAVRSDPRVHTVIAPDGESTPLTDRLISKDHHHALAHVMLKSDFAHAVLEYPSIRAKVKNTELTMLFTGHLARMHDMDVALREDLIRAELLSIPITLIVMLMAFRSVVASLLPIVVGGLSVVVGMSIVVAASHYTEIPQYATNVVSLVGLGVAIDYCLFIVSRYRDELSRGKSTNEAIVAAITTTGRAMLYSGLCVLVGLSGLLFFRGSYLWGMWLGGVVVVVMAMVHALTLLPALLALLGPRIDSGTVKIIPVGRADGFWRTLASTIMKRPWLALVPTVLVLVVASSPFGRITMGAFDIPALPAELESRRGWDTMKVHFPDETATRVVTVVEFPSAPALNEQRIAALYELSREIAKHPGVEKIESIVDLDPSLGKEDYSTILLNPPELYENLIRLALGYFVGGKVTLISAVTKGPADEFMTRLLVLKLREISNVADGKIYVTGTPAVDWDTVQFMEGNAALAVPTVMAITFILLVWMLRSIVLPLKAIAMNLLSIAASFGALVWIFQDGHFSSLLSFEPRPIEPVLPVLLFCTLFGLSMDYEVLMLSRMQEEFSKHGDNERAVGEGLERTGRLVSSAAGIMVAVFAAFAQARILPVKCMGVGMAIAVALDATLVRLLLVPATMKLMGGVNWWIPRWLDRIMPRLDHGD